MSQDFLILAAESPPPPFGGLPKNWEGSPLGSIEEVQAILANVAPDIKWTDAGWGVLERPNLSIEFNFGGKEPCKSIMLHVYGNTNDAFLKSLLQLLAKKYGWYTLDIERSEWFHHSSFSWQEQIQFNPIHQANWR